MDTAGSTAPPPKSTPKVTVTVPAVVTTERYCRPGQPRVLDPGSDWFALGKTIQELAVRMRKTLGLWFVLFDSFTKTCREGIRDLLRAGSV